MAKLPSTQTAQVQTVKVEATEVRAEVERIMRDPGWDLKAVSSAEWLESPKGHFVSTHYLIVAVRRWVA